MSYDATEITTAALLAAAARGGLAAMAALAGVPVVHTEATTTGEHIWGEPVADWTEAARIAARVGDLAHRAGYRVTDEWPKPGVIGYTGTPHAEVSVTDPFDIREEDGALYTWRSTHPDNVEVGDVLRTSTGAAVTVEAGVRIRGVVDSIILRHGGWTQRVYRRESARLED